MLPDEPTDEERQEQLAEDNETPFRPAADAPADATQSGIEAAEQTLSLPDDYPQTDTNIQLEELYDEGIAGAAEASEPNAGNAVVDYTPPPDDTAPSRQQ
ncbi:MAG TPA: hypothetical protein VFN56_03915 [Candidatus Saccharimonadales bacterium]|nr:hypothetical protein [Candidatus Saccharimonadales bacterium]